jgi:alkylhydroperoxidase family enzyme
MRTAEIVGSTYEINQHIPLAKMCGYSDAQIAALPTWQAPSLFDDEERGHARLCRRDGAWRRSR